ncbi:MAG: ferredoxin [Fibromonadaceae bacterium]|jgi:ferredoxin|nr:ferredoxin [Fibromonadaceae bacterium]
MAITKVWLDESENECSMCGACEAVCEAVFEVPEKVVVKDGADFAANEAEIKEAADGCPVGVIAYAEDGSDTRAN